MAAFDTHGLTIIIPGIETLDDGKGSSYIVCVARARARISRARS